MLDQGTVCRIDAHAAFAWPATIQQRTASGWLLRATPGLDRSRSNTALPPCRPLAPAEIEPAIEEAVEFARDHGIRPGIQVSPLAVHGALQRALDGRGWTTRWPALVLAGATGATGGGDRAAPGLERLDRPSEAWLQTWARCEPGRDVAAHADTVLAQLRGRATFARLGEDATAITVESDGLIGIFSLAVAPERRRTGLGTALVDSLLRSTRGGTAYLQVEERNEAALALYARFGFAEAYRYCHRLEPA